MLNSSQVINFQELVERDLTKNPQLGTMTYEQFYNKYKTLILLTHKSKSAPINEDIHFYDGFTPLIIACARNLEVLATKLLTDKTVNVAAVGPRGLTALHCATRNGNLELVKKLTERGADCTVKNAYNHSAIHFAAWSGHIETLNFILSIVGKEALEQEGEYTNLPLHIACQAGHSDAIILIVKNMKAESLGKTGVNGKNSLYLAAKAGALEGVKFLIDKQLPTYSLTKDNDILYAAVESGNLELYQFLKEAGASYTNHYHSFSHSLLKAAMKSQNPLLVKQILRDDKAEIEGYLNYNKNADGLPIYHAVVSGNLAIVELLVEYGARLNIPYREYDSPLEQATALKNEPIAKYLSEKMGADFVAWDKESEDDLSIKKDEEDPIDPDDNYNPLAGLCCIM
jgi:ankyrin repeat protein